jgi:hypothetical protein
LDVGLPFWLSAVIGAVFELEPESPERRSVVVLAFLRGFIVSMALSTGEVAHLGRCNGTCSAIGRGQKLES